MKRLAFAGLVILLLTMLAGSAVTRAQSPNRVALVVHMDGVIHTRCVNFDEPEISGYEVLARSGLAITAAFGPTGVAICAIEGTGCPAESCLLCAAPNYWSYWRLAGEQWLYSQLGAGATTVRHGDVEGWSWGRGSPPPLFSFEQICAPSPPTPTPEPPTATPTPVLPTPTPALPEAWFRLDQNPIQAGACTFVRWDVTNAHTAYLNDEAVPLSGSREVCPTETQFYTLRVIGAQGERRYEMTLGVLPSTSTPTVTPAPRRTPSPTATPAAILTLTPTAILPPTPTAPPPPTGTPVLLPSAAPTGTPVPLPSATPTGTPTATPMSEPAYGVMFPSVTPGTGGAISSITGPASGYAAFAALVGALVAGLVWRARRRG